MWVDKDDVIILPDMFWGNYSLTFCVRNSARIVHYKAYDEKLTRFNIESFETVIREQAQLNEKIITVLNFPHNPTGYLPTQEQLSELASIVDEKSLILFCDEMYFGLAHSGTPQISSTADVTKNAIVLSGLSKMYGLPGLRTGWLVIQNKELRENIINWKFYTSICASAPSEFLALAAWKVREQLRDRSIAQIEHNLGLVDSFFTRWPELFTWRKPMAGSVALVGMNVPSVTDFAVQLASKAGILILPATTLGSDDQHMRMGFGRVAFGEALEKFDAYLKEEF